MSVSIFNVSNHIYSAKFTIHAQSSCIIEFDGASKGNPGQAGAGAVLRAADGSMVLYFCLSMLD